MGFINDFIYALSGSGDRPQESTATQEKDISPNKEVASSNWDDKADFQLLLSLYKKYQSFQKIDFVAFVKEVNPEATPHRCPYCAVIHEFTASRARKCPSCGEKMIVRQERFITEQQAERVEELAQEAYRKQGLVMRVGGLLEYTQNSRVQKRSTDYFESLAESFRFMAQIENLRDQKGFSFWDKAWGYYGHARLIEMEELKQDMLPYSRLPDISWDMTQMIMDQANSETKKDSTERLKRRAITQACITLAEAAKLGADSYFRPELYGLIKKTMGELNMSSDEYRDIASKASVIMRLSEDTQKKYSAWLRELDEYEVIEHI